MSQRRKYIFGDDSSNTKKELPLIESDTCLYTVSIYFVLLLNAIL